MSYYFHMTSFAGIDEEPGGVFPVSLYQLKDGRFQPTQRGKLGPVMSGAGYVLLENQLAKYLVSLPVQGLTIRPVTIWVPSLDAENYDYYEAQISTCVSSSELVQLNDDGRLEIVLMDKEFLFVSPSLKQQLQNSSFEVYFSEGLTEFG